MKEYGDGVFGGARDPNAQLSSNLLSRLRARLITVPKPGTEPREIRYGEWFTCSTGSGNRKAGEDAGEQSLPSVSMYTGHNPPMRVQQHVYAIEPLCEEAAAEIERLRAALERMRERWAFLKSLVLERDEAGNDIPPWLALEWIENLSHSAEELAVDRAADETTGGQK